MKLRLLNGSHSSLAYIGLLLGYEYIHQAISDSVLCLFIEKFMDEEVTPTIYIPSGFDIDIYKKTIRHRFANSQVPYKTAQVANDGSQKLPQRLLTTALDLIRSNKSPKLISFIVAAWIRFLSGTDETGKQLNINDPKASELTNLAVNICSDDGISHKLLLEILAVISPTELIANEQFVHSVAFWLMEINKRGVKASMEKCLKFDN
jgi:fructuronate reductase